MRQFKKIFYNPLINRTRLTSVVQMVRFLFSFCRQRVWRRLPRLIIRRDLNYLHVFRSSRRIFNFYFYFCRLEVDFRGGPSDPLLAVFFFFQFLLFFSFLSSRFQLLKLFRSLFQIIFPHHLPSVPLFTSINYLEHFRCFSYWSRKTKKNFFLLKLQAWAFNLSLSLFLSPFPFFSPLSSFDFPFPRLRVNRWP